MWRSSGPTLRTGMHSLPQLGERLTANSGGQFALDDLFNLTNRERHSRHA